MVFNGEIFNYVELRAELAGLGHRFRTHSDTEVIVHAYEQWADGAFARFNGQFAVALWDSAAETLVLARDRLGVRPMYLCEHAGRLWFASEVKAIFAGDRTIPRGLDPLGLAETFTFWTTTAPQGVFAGVTRARARPRSDHLTRPHRGPGVLGTPVPGRRGDRHSRGLSTRPRRACVPRSRTPFACGCSARTCPLEATCPAGSTARLSPRSDAR